MLNLTPVSYTVIALICLMGIVHQWGDDIFPWWRLALAAYLAALAYEWFRVRTLSISAAHASEQPLKLGRLSELPLQFHLPSAIPERVIFVVDLPANIETSRADRHVTLSAQTTTTVLIPVRPVKVGRISWNQIPLRLLGPLRLGWWHRVIPLDAELEIVPDSLTRSDRTTGLAQSGSFAAHRVGSGQALHHLRQYQPGDPRHTIDWKASAKSNHLVTRVFGEDQHLDIVLVLDAGRTSRTRIDGLSQLGHYINLTARFAEQAVSNEDRIGLIAVTDRPVSVIPPGRGIGAVTRIRRELARLETQPVESDILAAAAELTRTVHRRCLILVLTDLYGAETTGRLNQSIRLWTPQHLPMVVGLIGGEISLLSDQKADDWLDPYVSLAANTWAEDVHRGMEGLRTLGAQTLLSRPRDLEGNVFNHYHRLKIQRRV